MIEMDVSIGEQTTTRLIPFGMDLQQPKDMTLFSITDFALVNAELPKRGILMRITMKRKIMTVKMRRSKSGYKNNKRHRLPYRKFRKKKRRAFLKPSLL